MSISRRLAVSKVRLLASVRSRLDHMHGEDHWHGAAPNRFMTHVAMLDVDDDGNNATWGDHVTDEEYDAAPTS